MDESVNQSGPIQPSGTPPQEETEITPDQHRTVKIVLIVFSLLFFIVIVLLGWNIYKTSRIETDENLNQSISPTVEIKPSQPITEEPSTPLSPTLIPPSAEIFESDQLGIRFVYPKITNGSQPIATYEDGDRVYVYPAAMDPQSGQWVEVFEKQSEESLENAINRLFLQGKNQQQCYVTILETEKNINAVTAIIDYPQDENDTMEQMFEKTQYCSEDYAKTNGIRYFWYDPQHPDMFLFFSIGQYGISVSEGVNWQDTIEIIN